jgi:hypothetical protein
MVQHTGPGRAGQLARDPAVGQDYDPVRGGRGGRVVRDHHDRLAVVADCGAEEGKQFSGGPAVEIAGRLVCEHDLGPSGQSPDRGNALLLTTRKLGGPVPQPGGDPGLADQLIHPAGVWFLAADPGWQRDVVEDAERRKQVEALKDEPDPGPAQQRQLPIRQRGQLGAANENPAAGQRVQGCEAVQQRRLARPRRSHNARELHGRQVQADAVERADGSPALPVGLDSGFRADRRRRRVGRPGRPGRSPLPVMRG